MNKKIMALFVLISFLTRIYIEAFSSNKQHALEKQLSHQKTVASSKKNLVKNNLH